MVFLRSIPSIESLARGDYFRESTIIYDKDKKPIYTLFKDGKRTYIEYSKISQYIKDAIVATEDKTFFTNPGIDIVGIGRAGVNYLLGRTQKISWTSTISQQLIKNTILTNEYSLKRKIQEAYLSYKLNNEYTKEKILEMYLNAFSFGYNANGIEEASKTYFWKSAMEVWPLWASILASLPKWPTYYSPYNHRDRLMGRIYIYPMSDPTRTIDLDTWEKKWEYKQFYAPLKSYLNSLMIEGKWTNVRLCSVKESYTRDSLYRPDSDGCIMITHDQLLGFFGDIIIKNTIESSGSTEDYALEYIIGRKDFVAGRMFEEGMIDGATFKKIVYDGLEFEFKKNISTIKYPYFVMYVKEYLETKYGKDIDVTSWLKVYTTLDPKLQDKAEEVLRKQVEINKKQYGASSAALVSMDNKTGKLLAMVWWPNYDDEANGGNNNMTTALRQPGSSFKPFIYGLAISKNPIGAESPVADVDTKFWGWHPSNYDGKFNGIMMVKNALSYSRNIPAAKMYFLAGQQDEIVKMVRTFWINTLRDEKDHSYGWPLALGAWEVRPIELMQAYSVYANLGIKRDLYFIDKIEDSSANILEEHVDNSKWENVFSPTASYIIAKILSDNDARPESTFWRNALTIPGRLVAAKTGTSNKEMDKKGDKILPRDLWTIGFTPQITTVVWAGNVDGKETKWNCDGLNCAAAIWKWYMEFALKDLPKEDWKKPEWVFSYTIAKASGKLATASTPADQKVSTLMAVKLTEYDDGMKEEKIDTLCNGPVSENTPEASIATLYIPSAIPIIDGYDPAWTTWFLAAIWASTGSGKIERSSAPCDRPSGPGDIVISLQTVWINGNLGTEWRKILEASWIGDRIITKFVLKSGQEILENITYGTWGKMNGSQRSSMSLKQWENTFFIELTDIYGYIYTESKTLMIGEAGTNPSWISKDPTITTMNPKNTDTRITLFAGDSFNLRFTTQISTDAREISVSIDGESIQNATAWELFVIPVGTAGITPGNHTLKIRVIDGNMKSAEKNIILTVLKR